MLVQFNSEENRVNYRSLWSKFINKVLNIGSLNTTNKTIAGAINELSNQANTLSGLTSTATAAGTTTLTVNSNNIQEFTGSTTQTIQMPVVSTLTLGRTFKIINNSTGILTVNSSGGNVVTTIESEITKIITCILITGTTAASWTVNDFGGGNDTNAIHDNIDGEINAITAKTTPVNADGFLIEDSADSYSKKKLTFQNLAAAIGGGGAATQVEQGSAYTFLGELLNENFPGTSLSGTNWSDSLPTGASVNEKLIIASGSAAWDRFITLSKHYLYEKLTIQVDVTAVTKNSGDAWGWGQTNFSAYTNTFVFWKFDQYTGILSAGSNSSANQYGEMQPIEFSAGDDLRFIWKRTPTKTYVTIENLTDSTVPKVQGEWDEFCKWGSGNYYRLTFLGGQQEFTNITIDSTVRNYVDNSDGVVVIGDSVGNGYGLGNRNDRFGDIVIKGQTHRYENLCVDSWGTQEFTTARLTEFLTNVNAKYLIINLGYNDASRNLALATYQTNLENLATTAQGLGFEVIFVSPWPNTGLDKSDYNTYMGNAATAVSALFYDIWDDLTDSDLGKKEYYHDGVHPNLWGHEEIARLIDLADGGIKDVLLDNFENDDIQFRGIGYSEELLPLCTIDHQGLVKKANPQKYINKNPVQLQQGVDSAGYPYYTQTGHIRITGSIHNDAPYIQKADSTGGKFGFSNDVDDTLGSNLMITNQQNASTRKQAFPSISGLRNIIISAKSVKTGTNAISGNDNFVLQTEFTSLSGDYNTLLNITQTIALTSGSNNIGIGRTALNTITTGQRNVHITWGRTGVATFSTGLSNTIIIGDTGYGNQYNQYDIGLNPAMSQHCRIWLGGKLGLSDGKEALISPARVWGTNYAGMTFNLHGGRGTGNANPAPLQIQCWTPVASGTGAHDNLHTTFKFEHNRTTSEEIFRLARYTAIEASALTPVDADLIYVTSTDATFTSVGVWAYENGTWIKL